MERTDLLLDVLKERFQSAISHACKSLESTEDISLVIDVRLARPCEPGTSAARVQNLHTEEIKLSSFLRTSSHTTAAREDSESRPVSPVEVSEQNTYEDSVDPTIASAHQTRRIATPDSTESDESEGRREGTQYGHRSSKRRKATGGLRLPPSGATTPDSIDKSVRQLKSDSRFFSKRKTSLEETRPQLKPSSLDRLIQGIWEKIHSGPGFDVAQIGQAQKQQITLNSGAHGNSMLLPDANFRRMNLLCRDISKASQACRAVELIVQASWIEAFNARVQRLAANREVRNMKVAIVEASQDFEWTEQQLRNKMAVWNGYNQIKEAGGWAALVFSGMGIYRFCKYRIGFDAESIQRLRSMRDRFELAADTLHPQWRNLLSIIGGSATPRYHGHPLDWTVDSSAAARRSSSLTPVPLAHAYAQFDPEFSFQHTDHCVVDVNVWPSIDPRHSFSTMRDGAYYCVVCSKLQSNDPKICECQCFPELFGTEVRACPVQVYRTNNGKNNGLLACCPFKRGVAVGEFVGLVTAGLKDLDVMEGEVEGRQYQVWQGRQGNHTKFVNHSCNPNTQFQKFFWLGVERVILVSKGVEAEEEITVDYSDSYWKHLNKECLCGSSACRYQHRRITGV